MNESDKLVLNAIAEVATPQGRHVQAPGDAMIEQIEDVLKQFGPQGLKGYRALLHAVDLAAVPLKGSRLHKLPPAERAAVLGALYDGATHLAVRAVVTPIKVAQARVATVEEAFGMGRPLPVAREPARWERQIVDARALDTDEELEVDAVVVGTGAGGGPVARALAADGFAVLMLEEGGHFTRQQFNGRPLEMQSLLYQKRGGTSAWGNTMIPIPLGRTVGGTTTINSGTCFRTPPSVLSRWQNDGLDELGPGELDSYFERVESRLEVAPTPDEVLGGCANVIARGAEALGYHHHPLARNAPGCDGQGVCCFGCPTDAKRSTNIAYVPSALSSGAMLYTGARVTRILVEDGRAVGVVAQARRLDGTRATITVRATAVVLSCGSIYTPSLLLAGELANSSGQVGRNLTIHPACYSFARFDEPIRGWDAVPQGYGVDEFADEGIRFEGAFLPMRVAAGFIGQLGAAWTDLIERFDELAIFGFMIADTSRGRVTINGRGRPRMTYWLNGTDLRQMVRGHAILSRIYLAAGAREVYPGLRFFNRIGSEADVERLESEGPGKLWPHHIDISAYHPLGTCRMGPDSRTSVIGSNHETHDIRNLFICDGSAVNGPLGVNPQVTIMALAERASEHIARRLDDEISQAAVPSARKSGEVEFSETMAGTCELLTGERAGEQVAISFCVRAALPELHGIVSELIDSGGEWHLDGTLDMDGFATASPCSGTLLMRPLKTTSTLIYDLNFCGDDGAGYTLRGDKHVKLPHPLDGITTLHTEISRDGELLARGILRFDLRDLVSWLGSWRRHSAA